MIKNHLPLALLTLLLAGHTPGQRPARTLDKEVLFNLLRKYDADRDGKINRSEYPRTDAAFTNLDRNRDGSIDATDFEPTAGRARGVGQARQPRPAKLPKVGEMAPDFELPLLSARAKELPTEDKDGEAAGKPAAEGGAAKPGKAPVETVKLSSFVGKKPVALIFGSYT